MGWERSSTEPWPRTCVSVNHALATGFWLINQTWVAVSLGIKNTEVRAYRTDPVQITSSIKKYFQPNNHVTMPRHDHTGWQRSSTEPWPRPWVSVNHALATWFWLINQTWVTVFLGIKNTEVRAYRTDPVQALLSTLIGSASFVPDFCKQ
ncbi:hypothetical protein Ccrd_003730, partial [Cynara cardunculus var. scolymus]